MKLFEISPLTFMSSLGVSLSEAMLLKKTGDSHLYGRCIRTRLACQNLKLLHEKRYFIFHLTIESRTWYPGTA
jgi:hypothetical protein